MALAFDLHGGRWFVERRAPDPPHALRICKQRGEARRHLPGVGELHHPPTRSDQTLLPGVGYHPLQAERAWRDVVAVLTECLLA